MTRPRSQLCAPRAGPAGNTPRRFRHHVDGHWCVQITQGELYVTADRTEMISTVLGSCIAVCMHDPAARIGGMNHFLLPEGNEDGASAMRYGVNAMELLVNDILKMGGARHRLEAKLFGGANVVSVLSDIGARNVQFARAYLENEGIKLSGGDIGGFEARRVQFWPATGRARRLTIAAGSQRLFLKELNEAQRAHGTGTGATSEVELF